MAVTEHELGRHRAYKQINNVVHQVYFKDKAEAEKEQQVLE